jgi:hypothetical protein
VTIADLLAQCAVLGLILLGLAYRHVICNDMTDGNVERLELNDRAAQAQWWLVRLERGWE